MTVVYMCQSILYFKHIKYCQKIPKFDVFSFLKSLANKKLDIKKIELIQYVLILWYLWRSLQKQLSVFTKKMELLPILQPSKFDELSETYSASQITISSLAQEYDKYFVERHTIRSFKIKQGWQKVEQDIFNWFQMKGIERGQPEILKQCHNTELRKTLVLKTKKTSIYASQNITTRRLKTKLTITM